MTAIDLIRRLRHKAVIMVHYCCVYNCYNSSADNNLSFHKFPKDEKLVKERNLAKFYGESSIRSLHVFTLWVQTIRFFFKFQDLDYSH